ncbi:hypothetical protein [Aureimonas endophytica]|nr:hypothetical protein [Aureimonas endophytica]
MVIAFPPDVAARLRSIEETEGVPDLEIVHLAVSVFSMLDADERHRLGQCALGMLVERHRRSRS